MQNKEQMQGYVMNFLKKNIPPAYTYHNYRHTLYVQEKAMALAIELNLKPHDIELINAAALWHDTGYVATYDGHEEESCRLAKEHLPGYGFNAADMNSICGMIMATRLPQRAHTLQEQVVADADLAYLGTSDAATQAGELFRELQSLNKVLTKEEWNKQQVSFIAAHRYFTKPYQDRVETAKHIYLSQLRKEL